ncbi:Coq4 family protein [Zavarzinia compransoris]|uniref:Coq4 family protein n=1 Tax=Zavarzinia marina TaxID=2911065 RepID=UPI001F470BBB|nr:Coq4 family protein [Zavarzinia marina]MCF4166413.1 Coq4 family protein [Zavarzinia marina]
MDSTTPIDERRPYRPLEAFRALRALLRDKEDTAQVFRIIDALGGPAFTKLYRRAIAMPGTREILERERSLCDVLSDRAYLASLPEGSFGREYLAFVEREQLTADGLVTASEEGHGERIRNDPLQRRLGERMRDAHDLYHIIGQYGRDGMGEVCVLSFTHGVSGNPGVLLVILGGLFKFRQEMPEQPVMRMAWQAWRIGRKAAFLPAADWEALLPLPTDEVRRRLKVGTPTRYLASGLMGSEEHAGDLAAA